MTTREELDLWSWLEAKSLEDVAHGVHHDDEVGDAFSAAVSAASTPAVLAAAELLGFGSDDTFSDFRVWLVLRGRETYETVLVNPDSLADVSIDHQEVAKSVIVGTWSENTPPEWSESRKRKALPRLFDLMRQDWSEAAVRRLVGSQWLRGFTTNLCDSILASGSARYDGLFTVSAVKSEWGVWMLDVAQSDVLTEALAARQPIPGATPAHRVLNALLGEVYPRAHRGDTLMFELGEPGALECSCDGSHIELRMRLGGTLLRTMKRARLHWAPAGPDGHTEP